MSFQRTALVGAVSLGIIACSGGDVAEAPPEAAQELSVGGVEEESRDAKAILQLVNEKTVLTLGKVNDGDAFSPGLEQDDASAISRVRFIERAVIRSLRQLVAIKTSAGVPIGTGVLQPLLRFAKKYGFNGTDTPLATTVPGWTWYHPKTINDLLAVHTRTDDDAWAVGTKGTILHWDGRTWSNVPGADPRLELYRVQAFGAGDAWAIGIDKATPPSEASPGPFSVLLHWNGSSWSEVATPIPIRATALWGSAQNDIFVTGTGLRPETPTKRDLNVVIHFNGSTWTEEPIFGWPVEGVFKNIGQPLVTSGSQGQPFMVSTTGFVWKREGNAWTRGDTRWLTNPHGVEISSATGTGDGALWMRSTYNGNLYSIGASSDVNDSRFQSKALFGYYAFSFDFAWVTGHLNEFGQFDGQDWRTVQVPLSAETIRAFSASSKRNMWAVGDMGQLLRFTRM
jgi:hypothetical protein